MNGSFVFNSVSRTHFGSGSVVDLVAVCQGLNVKKPLIVTDGGIIACGLLASTLANLEAAGLQPVVYDSVLPDPPESNLHESLALAKEQGCDGVIGFGGGSSMDVAKLVAAMLVSSQPLQEMYGVEMISGGRAPLVQVPTTAGTGSEATAVAIITTGESSKAGVVSPVLFADEIILDPELTIGLPAAVTAATGIDAMVHAIEAFTSIRLKNPLSDMVALQALRMLSVNIETAVQDGSNIEARSAMLIGAMLAGQAFANAPVAAVHALAYPLGGTYHIPHGLSNSLMLPHVLRFNSSHCADLYLQIAEAIDGVDAGQLTQPNIGDALAEHFFRLAERLGLQTRLRDMNIQRDALVSLAEQSMDQQRLLINNPRDVQLDDALKLYQEAY